VIPLPIIFAIISALVGLAVGYTFEHRARVAEVAQIRAEAAEEARRRIEAAQKAADSAIAQRDARIQALDATNRRLRNDLKDATTGRPCLSADARSVLQQSPAFSATVSSTTGGAASANAASTADSRYSTDADIAGWILDATALYEQCRSRIDALRAWDNSVYGK
jgi:hypothetical protein